MKPPFPSSQPTKSLSLSDRDKTPKPSGWGVDFHHTNPQRRVPCVLGEMLAPRSADDIQPITPEAMTSVQAALALLANLIADRDTNLFFGNSDEKLETNRTKAHDILLTAKGLAGILRVEPATKPIADAWRQAADYFHKLVWTRADEGTSIQLACLVLADYCEHWYTNNPYGPTGEMRALAENTISVRVDEIVAGFSRLGREEQP